jgi:hypothetical protein
MAVTDNQEQTEQNKIILFLTSGKLFGVFAVLEDVCVLLASAIYNSIFPSIRSTFPGGLFVASAVALVPTIAVLAFVRWRQNKSVECTKL